MRPAAAFRAARIISTVIGSSIAVLESSGGAMLAPPDTPHRSGCVHVDDQAAVVFDRKCVGGVDDRCGSGLLDGGGTIELVAGAKCLALIDPVFDRIAREAGVDFTGLERGRAGGAAVERGETRLVQGE